MPPMVLVPPVRSAPATPTSPPELAAPAVLTPDEATYWALWAPLAQSRGLLTDETRPGLVLLCQTAQRAAALWANIEALGFLCEIVTTDSQGRQDVKRQAHPLLSHWRALMARTEQLQARYGLAADGKAVASADVPAESESDQLAKFLAIR